MSDDFRTAVIDALVVGGIYSAAHDTDARKAVADLISWEVQIALDPNVSSDAEALLRKGAVQALENLERQFALFLSGVRANIAELSK